MKFASSPGDAAFAASIAEPVGKPGSGPGRLEGEGGRLLLDMRGAWAAVMAIADAFCRAVV